MSKTIRAKVWLGGEWRRVSAVLGTGEDGGPEFGEVQSSEPLSASERQQALDALWDKVEAMRDESEAMAEDYGRSQVPLLSARFPMGGGR